MTDFKIRRPAYSNMSKPPTKDLSTGVHSPCLARTHTMNHNSSRQSSFSTEEERHGCIPWIRRKLLRRFEGDEAPMEIASNTSSKDPVSNVIFCQLCANITEDALRSDEGYPHVSDIRQLQGLSEWCSLCRLLKLGIFQTAMSNPSNDKEISSIEAALALLKPMVEERGIMLGDIWPILLKVYSSPLGHTRVHFGTHGTRTGRHEETSEPLEPAMDLSLGHLILHRDGHMSPPPLLPRLPEESLFDRYLEWMESYGDQDAVLPSRVLDLQIQNSPLQHLDADLRLMETMGKKGTYATLSYCWGSYRGCLTEQVSYNNRLQCIKFAELPTLFQEAVFVTRKLGIRYLWIDALCIIQDSKEDWHREAAQMGDIYRQCQIRIAATVAKDPMESFYPPKPIVTSVRTKHVKIHDFLSDREEECFFTLPKLYVADVDNAWLNSRAWVLQERLLAPSTLHFCRDHIYFEEDDGTILGEDGNSSAFSWSSCVDRAGAGRMKLMQLRGRLSGRNYDEASDTSDSWLRIVELYSRCHITYATDKLIAISSLMKDRQLRGDFPYLGSKFFLGMWESTLHEDLLWVSEGSSNLKRLSSLGLPSWAWVGYEGAVEFLKDRRSLREISTVRTAPIPELEVLLFTGSYESVQLPLAEPVSMVTRLKLGKVFKVGSRIRKMQKALSHEEALPKSPFRHHKGIGSRPIPLCSRTDRFEILDDNNEMVGLFSLDTTDVPTETQLWCAHVATIHDESYRGSSPLSRLSYAWRVDNISGISGIGLGPGYEATSESHILAYCWILTSAGDKANQYQRVGMAEVRYEWISQSASVVISIF